MGNKRRTDGYHVRLKQALTFTDKVSGTMSVRTLGDRVEKAYPDVRGATYGGVRQYAEGKVVSPRLELLQAIADVLGCRWEWLAWNDGLPTEQEEAEAEFQRTIGSATEPPSTDDPKRPPRTRRAKGGGDPLTAAALAGLRETLPLGSHLVFEYRHLSGVAMKLGLNSYKGPDAKLAARYYRAAGRLIGECIAKPLEMLSAEIYEPLTAQAYVSAAAHAIEIVAHRATVKVDDADDTTEED